MVLGGGEERRFRGLLGASRLRHHGGTCGTTNGPFPGGRDRVGRAFSGFAARRVAQSCGWVWWWRRASSSWSSRMMMRQADAMSVPWSHISRARAARRIW